MKMKQKRSPLFHSAGCSTLFLTFLFSVLAFAQQHWERTYGGSDYDYGVSVQQTTDGGYIVAGGTESFGSGSQVYLIKTNASGDTLWTRTYGGEGEAFGWSVQQTTDGGYIVAGWTRLYTPAPVDVYLVKTNGQGDTLWTRTYGGADNDIGYSVQQTTDGGYIVGGFYELSNGSSQVYLIKTNASGDTLWTRIYGGWHWNDGFSVRQTSDGGYIVTGRTDSFGNSWQVYFVKTDAAGDSLWTRTYGSDIGEEYGYSVQQTSDGGYIVVGRTNLGNSISQVYLVKTNASGDTLWSRIYYDRENVVGYFVQQTSDGDYIIAGGTAFDWTRYDVYLLKVSASGDTLWTRTYGDNGGSYIDEGHSVQQTSDEGYIVTGGTESFGNGYQVYLIKTDANGNVALETPVNPLAGLTVGQLKATPNPFTSFTRIMGHEGERFALYDISGRKVAVHWGDRIGIGIAAGVYFIIPANRNAEPVRVVKVR